MGNVLRMIISSLCLLVAVACLGLFMFNFVFEKHEIKAEKRQEEVIHGMAGDGIISDLFDWSQEDNDKDRTLRKVVLVVIGTGSTAIGLITLPKRKHS